MSTRAYRRARCTRNRQAERRLFPSPGWSWTDLEKALPHRAVSKSEDLRPRSARHGLRDNGVSNSARWFCYAAVTAGVEVVAELGTLSGRLANNGRISESSMTTAITCREVSNRPVA